MNSTQQIKVKLQAFIRSYHLQQLLQGCLTTALQALVLFYLINYTEYLFWLESEVRGVLFYGFMGLIAVGVYVQIVRPLAKYALVSAQRLSEEHAAAIIGNHFEEISDKLLNLLQLEKMGTEAAHSALLLKSIEQKTEQLRPFAFTDALNWPAVRKNLMRFSAVLLLLIIWGIYDASSIKAASQRIFNYSETFQKPAPFRFIPSFTDTQVQTNSDVPVTLQLEGDAYPEEVFIRINEQSFLMKPDSKNRFTYQLKNIAANCDFLFEAAGFKGGEGRIRVIPKFELRNIQLKAIYPAYLGKPAEEISAMGVLQLPAGTKLEWSVLSTDAQNLYLTQDRVNAEKANKLPPKTKKIAPSRNAEFRFITQHVHNEDIKFWSVGNGLTSDTFGKQILVVADAYPEIQLEQKGNENNENNHYILGNAIDDYGISDVFLEYELEEGKEGNRSKRGLSFQANKTVVFAHAWDLKAMGIAANKGLRYRVGVTDNDALNGGKTTYSDWQYIRRWSDEMYEKQINQSQDKIEKQLAEAQAQAKKLQKQSDKLQESMSVSPQLSFDMQEKVENWLQKQEEQLERLSEIKKEQEQVDRQQQELAPKNEELKERREELNKRMERLEDPKLQELMKELQELLSRKKSPQEIQQKMDQIDRRMQSQKDDMDQLLEQLKELRMEEQIDLQGQEMQEWIDKQEELQRETEALEKQKEKSPEKEKAKNDLLKELQEQKEKAQQIEDRAKQIEEQNKKLQSPMKLDLGKPEIDEAQSKQNQASQKMQEQKASESKQAQQKAAEKMKEAQEKMQNSLEKAQKERNSEDLKALRALLENLIEVSHRQEKIFTELGSLNSDNPRVLSLNKEQMNIKNMSEGIEDSLRALAKRQPMVSDLVTREISDINDNMERAFEELKVRKVREAASYEQFVMTGYNNLAVMLMESLKNVQQRMNQQSSSSPKNGKMCENPKPGNSGKSQKGKGSKLSEAQKQLGEKLQQMQKEGQQGEQGSKQDGKKGEEGKKGQKGEKGDPKSGKDGKSKPGEKGEQQGQGGGSNGERISDKEWVEMVLMQEELRRKIETLRKEALKEGKTGQAANLFEAEKLMEEQEKKWVEKKLDAKMMWRQKQIETRLLEHEKAQMKQDQEDKRESNTSKNPDLVIPPDWIEKQRKKAEEKEKLQKGAPQWKPYYRQKSEEYLRKSQN